MIYKSRAIDYEISKMSKGNKKRQVEDLYDGLELEKYNIHFMDGYHIAFAESKEVDYLITVDKQLINASKNAKLKLKVINPVEFVMEVV